MVTEINNQSFEAEVLNSDKPVLVDFWAEWCGPCRMLAPIVDGLSEEYSDKFKFCKVNVDDEHELAIKFNVRNIPTLLVFKNGEQVDKLIGLRPREEIISVLDA